MGHVLLPLAALLGGIATLLVGNGLLGTLLSVRTVALGYPAEVTGLVMAAYFVGFIIGSVHCVALVERAGHVRTFAALASVASAASLAYLLVVSPLAWSILRALTGYCFAGLFMVTESWLNERADNANRGRVLSSYMLVNLIALASGQFLLVVPDPGGYELFCLSSILVSLGLVPISLSRTIAPAPPRARPMRPGRLFAASPLGTVGCFTSGLVMSAFWAMAPVFCRRLGLSDLGIAVYMSATILGGLISIWPVGRLSDRYDRRAVIVAVCAVSAAASLAIALLAARDLGALLALTAAFGAASFPLYSLALAHTNDFLGRDDVVPASSGLLLTYGIGAIAGPAIAGFCMGWLGRDGLHYFAAASMVCLVAFGVVRMSLGSPVPPEEKTPIQPVPRTTHVAYELDPRAPPQPEVPADSEGRENPSLQNAPPTR